jgi:hypothetical protein
MLTKHFFVMIFLFSMTKRAFSVFTLVSIKLVTKQDGLSGGRFV